MAFQEFIRTKVQAREPVISLGDNKFHYSSVFSKLAELGSNNYVGYFFDEATREIAFKFYKKRNSRNSYTLINKNGQKFRSAAGEVMKRFPWVDKVARAKQVDDRKFVATEKQGMWVIQLAPAFEITVFRNDAPSNLPDKSGIYRYTNEDDEIVYIGKGNIKTRYSEQSRKEWIFSKVEYSIVSGDKEQYEWESYWIEKFKESSSGYLPYYNNVSGHQSKE